jgi:hypothetical protein
MVYGAQRFRSVEATSSDSIRTAIDIPQSARRIGFGYQNNR